MHSAPIEQPAVATRKSTLPRTARRLATQGTCVMALMLSDLLAFAGALELAIVGRNGVLSPLFPSLQPPRFTLVDYLGFWWMPVIFVAFLGFEGLYNRRRTFWDEVKVLWKSTTLASLTILAVIALGKLSPLVSRLTLLIAWLMLLVVMPVTRLLTKRLLFRLGLWRRAVIILGAGEAGRSAMGALAREPMLGNEVVGFLDDEAGVQGTIVGTFHGEPVRVQGPLDLAEAMLRRGEAQDALIAIPWLTEDQMLQLVSRLQRVAQSIRIVPNIRNLPMMSLEVDQFLHDRMFTVTVPFNLANPWNIALKRAFDLAAAVALIGIFAPLLTVIAIAVKLTSRGPLIHRRLVVGRHARPFHFFKFRTMIANADQALARLLQEDERAKDEYERHYKLASDPRVTPLGLFLRRTSLDELPQLFNVLGGSMSLIGPRPVVQEELDRYYREMTDWYTCVKPGISGLWQVSGRSDLPYDERIALDLWYVRNWSLWLDLVISLRTVRAVLKREGAH